MKRFLGILLCITMLLGMSGCSRLVERIVADTIDSVVDDVMTDVFDEIDYSVDWNQEWKLQKQKIDIYSKDGTLLQTRSGGEQVLTFTKILVQKVVSWRYPSGIPKDASLLYSYELWQEDQASPLPIGERPVILGCIFYLYQYQSNYYLHMDFLDQAEDFQFAYVGLPEETGRAMEQFAQDTKMETSRSEIDLEEMQKGVAMVSKNQRLEVSDANSHELLFHTSSIEAIAEYVAGEQMEDWVFISQLPTDAQPVYSFARYAEDRKKIDHPLQKQYEDTLYQVNQNYYIKTKILGNPQMPEYTVIYQIPSSAANHLCTFWK